MENYTFKRALIGGFRRADVAAYLEKAAAEARGRVTALEEREAALTRDAAALREELASVTDERDRLSASERECLARRDELQAALAAAASERDALREKLASVTLERDALQSEVGVLRPQAEEFAAVKANLTELELAARARADAYEAAARVRADEYSRRSIEKLGALLDGCRAQCDTILSALDDACASVSAELENSSGTVSRLPAAFDTLRRDLDALRAPGGDGEDRHD